MFGLQRVEIIAGRPGSSEKIVYDGQFSIAVLPSQESGFMNSSIELTDEDILADQRWLGAEVPSLLPVAWDEIQRHKWIESEKARRDVGHAAIDDWLSRFWWRFCRWRRIEHVEGIQRWFEFSHEDFAKLVRPILDDDRLMLVIIELMKADRIRVMSDLEVIEWARDACVPMNRVLEILGEIHINDARLEPPVEWLRWSTKGSVN